MTQETIRNPVEWTWERLGEAAAGVASVGRAIGHMEDMRAREAPTVRRIGVADLGEAIAAGFRDFGAFRTDVFALCIIYPILGCVLARAAVNLNMLPMLFPLASGFVLVGPVAAIGLLEMSRQRERGAQPSWREAFGPLRSPAIAAIAALGFLLTVIYFAWLYAAQGIYDATLGPQPPASVAQFAADVAGSGAGWTMIAVGCAVGAGFAALVLAIAAISFPLLLDRDVPLHTAVGTSMRAVARNPGVMALWGLIVAGSLLAGTLPAFVGLIVVMPVLGHSTWHLYRRLVA
ncbi:putative membrane protein [Nitrospirillum amazonense]|uniref:Putative membrane protein n=1 Tax=Nitrospirillum amazonense TaxID=28077 RepID=A0A560FK38_9PROT|nr:DUF2189 domain-containing protein [Nitrospirillum amazonense]TWB21970.1 putative membrane protein [Nitrospirillum amazonense]